MTDTETTYFAAEMLDGKPDFRAGWTVEHHVVALMSTDMADRIGRLMISAAAIVRTRDEEHELVVGAINLFTAAARASVAVGPDLQLVRKVDLPTSAADLDARDHANTDPAAEPSATPTTWRCICGEEHPRDGDALAAPLGDGKFHGVPAPFDTSSSAAGAVRAGEAQP